MHKNISLIIFSVWFLTIGLVTSGGCGWMSVLDTNPYDDRPSNEDRKYCKYYIDQIRMDLLGLKKIDILSKFGKPKKKNVFNKFKMTSKFRKSEYVFDGNKKCLMSECEPIYMSESWVYESSVPVHDKEIQYEWVVYFYKDTVVAVE